MNFNNQNINKQDLEHFIKTNLSFKDYLAYANKIVFNIKLNKSGETKISKNLKNFSKFNYLYVKIGNKYKKFKIYKSKDRKYKIYMSKIGSNYKHKSFEAYLKTNSEFYNVLNKAFKNQSNIPDFYKNNDFRIAVNNDGKLLLKFLVPSLVRGKEFYTLHNILTNHVESLTSNNLKNILDSLKINPKLLIPFLKNYFVVKLKEEIKFIPARLKSEGKFYRALGIINGDGHLGHLMAVCYGNEDFVHKDFREGLEHIHQPLKFISSADKVSNVKKTQVNSSILFKKLIALGAIEGNKLKNVKKISIPKDFYTYIEYLAGMFDTEGSFIEDSHLILPASISVKEFNLLNKRQNKLLLKLAKEKGRYQKIEYSNSEYYALGLRLLRKMNQGEAIIKRIYNSPPPITLLNKKILDELGIYSKIELKSLYIYPKSKNINANFWLKITPIKDIIKFFCLIDLHSTKKREKIKSFVFKYISEQDYDEIKNFINQNLRFYNGSSTNWLISKKGNRIK